MALGAGVALLAAFVASGLFAALVPAWENNDEFQHVQYIEYVAHHAAAPPISPANGWESGQPPLYYFVAAGWQALLQIPPFRPILLPPIPRITGPVHLELDHQYSSAERTQAVAVHELRALSVVLGLVTVLAIFGTAFLATHRLLLASAAATFAALIPKNAEIFGAVTNDSLATCCCAVATFLFLLWHSTPAGRGGLTRAALLGLALGLGAITKYTTLPVIGLLLVAMAATAWVRRRGGLDTAVAMVVMAAVAGWWYVRNLMQTGQLFEQTRNEVMLRHFFPGQLLVTSLRPPALGGWLVTTLKGVAQTFWYVGGWNQLTMPTKASYVLGLGALVAALWGLARLARGSAASLTVAQARATAGTLTLVAAGGLAAALTVAAATTQYQGRYVLVGVAAISTLVVAGTADLGSKFGRTGAVLGALAWPMVMVVVISWVFAVNVLPLAGL